MSQVDQHAEALVRDPLFLDRCQHDTPDALVQLAWKLAHVRRGAFRSVVDFGAGDGRFASGGTYGSYVGYEIDRRRIPVRLNGDIAIVNACAFSHRDQTADLAIGNPPYVRNQDLPIGWRQMASKEIALRTGVQLSGLANAWQYFLMLALWSTSTDGLVVQVLPFEWTYRPAAKAVRSFIEKHGWRVDVYRLPDGVFNDVLTSASVTIVDKRVADGRWRYYEQGSDGTIKPIQQPTGSDLGVLPYQRPRSDAFQVRRGLSPGTQRALVLTEGERAHAGLRVGADVRRCVTSLRPLPADEDAIDVARFNTHFRDAGARCWLINTTVEPSPRLRAYLDGVDPHLYQTATCLDREDWWRFPMPSPPGVLFAQAFTGRGPKIVTNEASVLAVGGVCGIFVGSDQAVALRDALLELDFATQVVDYAGRMRKVEINQLNAVVDQLYASGRLR